MLVGNDGNNTSFFGGDGSGNGIPVDGTLPYEEGGNRHNDPLGDLIGDASITAIYGLDGHDTLIGGNVAGILLDGGPGHDILDDDNQAGPGGILLGQAGHDILFGNGGDDYIDAGADNDFAEGNAGQGTVRGGGGTDWLDGYQGSDVLHGGLDTDRLHGGAGDDALFGEEGNDTLYGDSQFGAGTYLIRCLDGGADTLYGVKRFNPSLMVL